jgi:hypothetical protein
MTPEEHTELADFHRRMSEHMRAVAEHLYAEGDDEMAEAWSLQADHAWLAMRLHGALRAIELHRENSLANYAEHPEVEIWKGDLALWEALQRDEEDAQILFGDDDDIDDDVEIVVIDSPFDWPSQN